MKTTIELRGADGRMIQSSRFTPEHKGTGAKVNPFAVQQVELMLNFLLFLAENAVGRGSRRRRCGCPNQSLRIARSGRLNAKMTTPAKAATAAIIRKKCTLSMLLQKLPR